MWIKQFKIALIQQDVDTIDTLLSEMPQFSNLDEMEEAIFLMKESRTLLEKLKLDAKKTAEHLKHNIELLNASQSETPSTINIKL